MPPLGSISRRDLIARLRGLGFDRPLPGGDHQYMVRGDRRVHIPDPHQGDIGPNLLAKVLRDARVSRSEWERER